MREQDQMELYMELSENDQKIQDVHKGAEYGNQSKTHSGLIFVQQL